jgi:hypothetical protein
MRWMATAPNMGAWLLYWWTNAPHIVLFAGSQVAVNGRKPVQCRWRAQPSITKVVLTNTNWSILCSGASKKTRPLAQRRKFMLPWLNCRCR